MEHRENKSRIDRREVHSVYVPVPTIVLNSSNEKNDSASLSHSRSAGDLDMTLNDTDEFQASGLPKGMSKFSSSVADGIQESDCINAIGLYCSPRMLRKTAKSPEEEPHKHSRLFLESVNACNLNCLDPGSRVGSSVSLNSEYTSRSIGLISNDSSSECSHHHYGAAGSMEGSTHKHGVLKRFYSTPEKDGDILTYTSNVRRNSKSMGNMQLDDLDNFVSFDFGSDSTEDNSRHINVPSCDIDESLEKRTAYTEEDISGDVPTEKNLVTAVTGSSSLRDGRIRKWLTEISSPDENSNS
ncbi:hypothetical protein ACF0H5_016404 [Mactra antiquata]